MREATERVTKERRGTGQLVMQLAPFLGSRGQQSLEPRDFARVGLFVYGGLGPAL